MRPSLRASCNVAISSLRFSEGLTGLGVKNSASLSNKLFCSGSGIVDRAYLIFMTDRDFRGLIGLRGLLLMIPLLELLLYLHGQNLEHEVSRGSVNG